MIRRTAKTIARLVAVTGLVGFASLSQAGTVAVSPALAACSKALIETIAKGDTLPSYKIKAPSAFVSDLVDPHAFTVFATSVKTKELLAKASCKATPAGEIVSFKSIPLKS